MITVRGINRNPYVLMLRTVIPGEPARHIPQRQFRTLKAALTACTEVNDCWNSMMKSWGSPLSWYVRDARDGSEHHLPRHFRGDNRVKDAAKKPLTLY